MSKTHDIEIVKTNLQIEEELEAHKKGWVAQRIGLICIYILVIAAAAGLFGDGFASKQAQSIQQITVESERFYRFQAIMELKITATNISSNDLIVAFPNEYFRNFEVKSIVPEPAENRFINDNMEYRFKATGDANVTFFLSPETRGKISGSVNVNEQPFQLNHFIFP